MRILTALFALAFCGCSMFPVVVNQDDDPADCQAAFENLLALGCEEALGSPGEDEIFNTPDDVSFVTICEEVARDMNAEISPGCLAEIKSCNGADSCAN